MATPSAIAQPLPNGEWRTRKSASGRSPKSAHLGLVGFVIAAALAAAPCSADTEDTDGEGGIRDVHFERLELLPGDNGSQILWEGAAWIGAHKLRVKTEGEYDIDEGIFPEAEVHLLFCRAITPTLHLQTGLHQHLGKDDVASYLNLGVQGEIAYGIELDAEVFGGAKGRVLTRTELEREYALTERLELRLRGEWIAAIDQGSDPVHRPPRHSLHGGVRLGFAATSNLSWHVGVRWGKEYGESEPEHDAPDANGHGEEEGGFGALIGIAFEL